MKVASLVDGLKYVEDVVDTLLATKNVKTAVKYVSPNLIVRATRRGRHDGRDKNIDMVLAIGKPNYRERDFIKDCKKAGEKFPIRGIILKYFPEKKK